MFAKIIGVSLIFHQFSIINGHAGNEVHMKHLSNERLIGEGNLNITIENFELKNEWQTETPLMFITVMKETLEDYQLKLLADFSIQAVNNERPDLDCAAFHLNHTLIRSRMTTAVKIDFASERWLVYHSLGEHGTLLGHELLPSSNLNLSLTLINGTTYLSIRLRIPVRSDFGDGFFQVHLHSCGIMWPSFKDSIKMYYTNGIYWLGQTRSKFLDCTCFWWGLRLCFDAAIFLFLTQFFSAHSVIVRRIYPKEWFYFNSRFFVFNLPKVILHSLVCREIQPNYYLETDFGIRLLIKACLVAAIAYQHNNVKRLKLKIPHVHISIYLSICSLFIPKLDSTFNVYCIIFFTIIHQSYFVTFLVSRLLRHEQFPKSLVPCVENMIKRSYCIIIAYQCVLSFDLVPLAMCAIGVEHAERLIGRCIIEDILSSFVYNFHTLSFVMIVAKAFKSNSLI